MFSTLGLFRQLPCPQLDICTRQNCLYSHLPSARASSFVSQRQPAVSSAAQSTLGRSVTQSKPVETVPAKRPAISQVKRSSVSTEPPRKLQKVGPTQRPLATIPTSTKAQDKPSTSRTEVCSIEVMVLSTQWLLLIFSLAFQSSGSMLHNPWFHFLFDKYVPGTSRICFDRRTLFCRRCSRLFMIILWSYTIKFCP